MVDHVKSSTPKGHIGARLGVLATSHESRSPYTDFRAPANVASVQDLPSAVQVATGGTVELL
jgi:hypothetical protein